uniref:NADH-ubiquinone oxidoreductase chain 5 n=1 Tax=Uzeldikra longiprocessa TaxID=2893152 RepID=A0A9E7BY41_9HEMI|nr:NADH dehydrogenase subunit 5 [Uzeldikra longiprocessa]UGN61297.1 NADH dehydrogenase subunit 5 [Uzeldikra longiprocessa]
MKKLNFYVIWFFFFFFFSLITFLISFYLIVHDFSILIEWKLFSLNSYNLIYLLLFDWISLLFISIVMFISSLVILYSVDYMGVCNYSSNRFLFLVVMFVLSMILMLISPNLVSILLGWDGLGLVSYCLVIYYNSVKSYLAGMITCLINRLGDIGLLISIAWITSFGSWHFMFYSFMYDNFIIYMVIISSFTKSAQIPFSIWLPAAMAAPTPVSALVHSSTLVTAGVYLLIRFFNYFVLYNYIFLFLSVMTMFMSSFCANYEFDLKKIIALSTLSQLGLMMSSLFMGLINLSFFHLLTHAMFKSLLFLCAGIFIYYMNDNQDVRYMGSVCSFMPFTTSSFNISSMALCGIPFLSGFYSKDLIIEFSSFYLMNIFYFIIFYVSLGLTCCYSIRLFYYSMLYDCKFNFLICIYEDYNFMKLSIYILTLCSVFFGCSLLWMISIDLNFIFLPFFNKILSMLMVMLGMFLGYQLFDFKSYLMSTYYYFFTNMWFLFSYSYYLYSTLYTFSFMYSLNLNWGEFYGSMGLSYYFLRLSNFIQFYSINNFKIMFFSFLVWFFIIF